MYSIIYEFYTHKQYKLNNIVWHWDTLALPKTINLWTMCGLLYWCLIDRAASSSFMNMDRTECYLETKERESDRPSRETKEEGIRAGWAELASERSSELSSYERASERESELASERASERRASEQAIYISIIDRSIDSIERSIYLSIYLSHLSIYLYYPIYLSIYPSVYLSTAETTFSCLRKKEAVWLCYIRQLNKQVDHIE